MTTRINRNIRLLEANSACHSMLFIIPVLIPFYRDHIGLSFGDFLLGESCFAAMMVLCEVPSGWLSDVWTRKRVLLLAAAIDVAGFALLGFANSLATAIAVQMLLAVSVSLVSGTDSAMLYDTLLTAGRQDEFVRLDGRRRGMGFYAIAIASIAGGFMYAIDIMLPIYMSVAASAAACVVTMLMDEPSRHKKLAEKHPLADMVETMRFAFRGHADVLVIVLFAAALFSATKAIMWSQQPYYMALGLHESMFGILMAVGYILAGTSMHASHWIGRHVSLRGALAGCIGAAIVVTGAAGAVVGLHGVGLLMLGGSCLFGIASPRVDDAINRSTGSARRATVLSTASLMRQLAFVPLSLLTGWLSNRYGIGGALLGLSGWLCIGALCLIVWTRLRR